MVGYRNNSDVAKKAAEVAQKKEEQLAHGEFCIHKGSEITTWMGHSFNTKNTTSRATFLLWYV